MTKARRWVAAVAASVVSAGVCAVVGSTVPAGAAAVGTLPGSAAPVAASARASLGAVASGQQLTVQLWLRPAVAAASAFADAVATPGHAGYHKYLTPAQYTARFGPSRAEAATVGGWLTGQGLHGVTVSAQRDYVTATGPVSTVNAAFGITMTRYRVAGPDGKTATIWSNNRDVSLPGSIVGDVEAVTGLDTAQPSTYHTARNVPAAGTAAPPCSPYWGALAYPLRPAYQGISSSPLAVCGYSATQLRRAYGATAAATGTGRTVALIEIGTPYRMFDTLAQYAKSNGLPAPKGTQFKELVIGRGGACGNYFDIEEQLDSEATYALAPGANQLMVDGDSCDLGLQGVQPLFDAELAVLTGNGNAASAAIESNSWGITGGEAWPKVYATTADTINLRAAAEGVSMLFSSGDNPGISVPASDPYSLAVGGTTVGIGQAGNRLFETGWSNDDVVFDKTWQDFGIGRDAAGGGASLLFARPAYQNGVVPPSMASPGVGRSQLNRAVPDIAADADPNTGILQGVIVAGAKGQPDQYQTFVDGGTSLASPLVAGMLADAEQGQATSLGFVNPLLYSLHGTAALHDTLPASAYPAIDRTGYTPYGGGVYQLSIFDSQLPAYTDQVTAAGYDTMTGLGTPNGAAFIIGLHHGSTR